MANTFEKLLKMAYADGVLTDKERELLMRKADELKIDPIEAEMMIESYQVNQPKSSEEADDYDITNEELLRRLNYLVNKLGSEKTVEVRMDPFPALLKEGDKFGARVNSARKALSKVTKSNALSEAASIAGSMTKIPGSRFVGKLAGKGVESVLHKMAGTETKNLKHVEILEIVDRYILILVKRANIDDYLEKCYSELTQKVNHHKNNIPKKKGWF